MRYSRDSNIKLDLKFEMQGKRHRKAATITTLATARAVTITTLATARAETITTLVTARAGTITASSSRSASALKSPSATTLPGPPPGPDAAVTGQIKSHASADVNRCTF